MKHIRRRRPPEAPVQSGSLRTTANTLDRISTAALLRSLPDAPLPSQSGGRGVIGCRHLLLWWLQARGGLLGLDEIIDMFWGHDPEGAPIHSEKCVHIMIFMLRRTGHRIETVHGRWYRLRPDLSRSDLRAPVPEIPDASLSFEARTRTP